jgi:hypothetical protein
VIGKIAKEKKKAYKKEKLLNFLLEMEQEFLLSSDATQRRQAQTEQLHDREKIQHCQTHTLGSC